MSFRSTDQIEKQTSTGPLLSSGFLQCKSSFDEHTFDGGKFADLCSPEHTFNSTSIGMSKAPGFGHDFSLIPTHSDIVRQAMPSLKTGTMVQRFPEATTEETPPASEAAPTPAAPEAEEESAAPEETAAPALIVEDSVTELSAGQMRKSEFLAQLRAAVISTAESAMAGTGRTTADCPYLDYWFDYYSTQDAQHCERALRRYAPEASSVTSAREYIPIIAARVRRSVETWVRTGEVTGVPEGLPGMGLLGSIGRLFSGIGSIFFKARNGGARQPNNPRAIQSQLGSGQSLDSGVRARMESAFGMDFSRVRTHTDTTAAGLSDRLNARAFTVGEHIAFGAGEYRPGTLMGDALIAHEMAHVVQQGGESTTVSPLEVGNTNYYALEEDADESAVGAIASLLRGARGVGSNLTKNTVPRLMSGLKLQRCSSDSDKAMPPAKLASLCDQKKCLRRSGCKANKCKEEASTIADTYIKRVNAIRRPDIPNRGDIHWGWLCYQWADLLTKEFEKLSLQCWKLPWVGIATSPIGVSNRRLEHNYILASLGPIESSEGPVRDCGMVLDPWRTGDPVVYEGGWDWHKWNYIHDPRNNKGKYYEHGKWIELTFPIPPTPEPETRSTR